MKTTIKTLLIMTGLFASLPAVAEDVTKEEAKPESAKKEGQKGKGKANNFIKKKIDEICKDIPNLTDEQKPKIAEIIKHRVAGSRKIKAFADGGASKDEVAAKKKALYKEVNGKIKAVLTPEQFKALNKARKARAQAAQKKKTGDEGKNDEAEKKKAE